MTQKAPSGCICDSVRILFVSVTASVVTTTQDKVSPGLKPLPCITVLMRPVCAVLYTVRSRCFCADNMHSALELQIKNRFGNSYMTHFLASRYNRGLCRHSYICVANEMFAPVGFFQHVFQGGTFVNSQSCWSRCTYVALYHSPRYNAS